MSEPQEPRDELSGPEREELTRYVERFRTLPAPMQVQVAEAAVARLEGWA